MNPVSAVHQLRVFDEMGLGPLWLSKHPVTAETAETAETAVFIPPEVEQAVLGRGELVARKVLRPRRQRGRRRFRRLAVRESRWGPRMCFG